jgi:hypothetical protein
MTKLLGVNWEGRLAALLMSAAGLGLLADQLGIADTPVGKWMVKISVGAAFASSIYAKFKQKSSDVTGAGTDAIKVK